MQSAVDILLIEDNEDDAEMIIRELRKNHLAEKLVHLKDGAAAIDFIGSINEQAVTGDEYGLPKFILLDIKMPKINGMEVLEKIKSCSSTQNIPVVIFTSSSEDADLKRCYDLGANSYLVKPMNFKRFSEAIRALGFQWLLLNQSTR
jgi:two-component system, response regulator